MCTSVIACLKKIFCWIVLLCVSLVRSVYLCLVCLVYSSHFKIFDLDVHFIHKRTHSFDCFYSLQWNDSPQRLGSWRGAACSPWHIPHYCSPLSPADLCKSCTDRSSLSYSSSCQKRSFSHTKRAKCSSETEWQTARTEASW